MKPNNTISDEFLNAFVDDQLVSTEKGQAFDMIEQDASLKERVCDLRGLKEVMQHAYQAPPTLKKSPAKGLPEWPPFFQALAAGLLLFIGGASGWFTHAWTSPESDRTMIHMLQASQRNNFGVEPKKIIVHVGTSNPVRLKTALDETENLLHSSQQNHQELEVEIVANGTGIDLLRSGISPYSQRIAQLQEKYPNLALIACSQTLSKLQERGLSVHLLPHTGVAPSAVDQITKRVQQGWDYIKV